ncbi:MAG: hypothetical protein J6Y02_22125 [Pseudobutyrivibrio sp.]|nr:hypothetical protein [Pseudobutyrivibrio sp.]
MRTIRTYSELILLDTFEERFNYLKVKAPIGAITFGGHRYACQQFYRSPEWKRVCRDVILRDNCCDLGLPGYEIERIPGDRSRNDIVIVHHMNPITIEQILERDPDILNMEYLITTRHSTHNCIHYGEDGVIPEMRLVVRTPNDTAIWK